MNRRRVGVHQGGAKSAFVVFIPYAATLKAFGLEFERMRPHGGEATPRSNYGVELSALGRVIKSALQDYLHLQRPLAL